VADVQRAVSTCTAASARLTAALHGGQRLASANAAIDARNGCATARAAVARTAPDNPLFDPCRQAIDAQIAVHRRELAMLDAPTQDNGNAVLAQLDTAIRADRSCEAALDRAEHPAS
jgi:hypothetical protein